jgi:hypothetical protein
VTLTGINAIMKPIAEQPYQKHRQSGTMKSPTTSAAVKSTIHLVSAERAIDLTWRARATVLRRSNSQDCCHGLEQLLEWFCAFELDRDAAAARCSL